MKVCRKCRIEKELDDFFRDRSRKDGHQSECKQCATEYSKQLAVRNVRQRRHTEWRERNKKKVKAQSIINNGLKRGIIKAEDCVICGKRPVHGHHIDYDYPDKVIWLCITHHSMAHHG